MSHSEFQAELGRIVTERGEPTSTVIEREGQTYPYPFKLKDLWRKVEANELQLQPSSPAKLDVGGDIGALPIDHVEVIDADDGTFSVKIACL